MFSKITSIGLLGLDGFLVEVEADISNGLPKFDIVGLPGASVNESRDRVRAAIKNSGMDFPGGKIIINLAPADIKKDSPLYDLPILIALLKASKQISENLDGAAFIGELSLDAQLRPVNGILPMILEAKALGISKAFIPHLNAPEASVVEGVETYPVKSIKQLLEHLKGVSEVKPATKSDFQSAGDKILPDFSEVKGQYEAKRALEVAATGGHNIMLIGPPGSGKSMLAKRLPSILPDMSFEESLETTKIHSITGIIPKGVSLIKSRPFRSPHHTISSAGLSGGGVMPKPGEISLAHNGVLFLDELPEFSRASMEALRQPIEDDKITISRVSGRLVYPCSIMLVCAMNPCPCGYYGHPSKRCSCSEGAAAKYLSKVSGPLLDRLDIHIEVPPVEYEQLASKRTGESSSEIKKRVNSARKFALERLENGITCNAKMDSLSISKRCSLTEQGQILLKKAFDKMGLSARAYEKVLKLSRTIADLDQKESIETCHITEALQYRSLDRKYWRRES